MLRIPYLLFFVFLSFFPFLSFFAFFSLFSFLPKNPVPTEGITDHQSLFLKGSTCNSTVDIAPGSEYLKYTSVNTASPAVPATLTKNVNLHRSHIHVCVAVVVLLCCGCDVLCCCVVLLLFVVVLLFCVVLCCVMVCGIVLRCVVCCCVVVLCCAVVCSVVLCCSEVWYVLLYCCVALCWLPRNSGWTQFDVSAYDDVSEYGAQWGREEGDIHPHPFPIEQGQYDHTSA